MGNMFKSTKSTPEYSAVADPYQSVREPLLSWLNQEIGKPAEQYKGEMVAESTPQEKQSLDFLQKYVDQGSSEGMNLANDEIKKTMTGQYDPTSSPYYQAVKAESAKNLEEAQNSIADKAAGGGRFWSGARLKEQGDASNDAAIAMNKLLYGMAETERGRRLSSVPMAAELGQLEEQKPLAKTQALQSAGSLNRILQQARDEAIYNEWLRSTQEYPLQIGSLASGLAREPYYAQTTTKPSAFKQLLSGSKVGDLIGSMFG